MLLLTHTVYCYSLCYSLLIQLCYVTPYSYSVEEAEIIKLAHWLPSFGPRLFLALSQLLLRLDLLKILAQQSFSVNSR